MKPKELLAAGIKLIGIIALYKMIFNIPNVIVTLSYSETYKDIITKNPLFVILVPVIYLVVAFLFIFDTDDITEFIFKNVFTVDKMFVFLSVCCQILGLYFAVECFAGIFLDIQGIGAENFKVRNGQVLIDKSVWIDEAENLTGLILWLLLAFKTKDILHFLRGKK